MQTNLSISEPFDNCVYQCDNTNKSFIPIVGTTTPGIEFITVVFQPVQAGQISIEQQSITQVVSCDTAGVFSARVIVAAGLYNCLVTAGDNQAQALLIGAGDVWILYGHSFISGGHDKTHQKYATDPRVFALQDRVEAVGYHFDRLTQTIGPMHDWPDAWGMLFDKLAAKYNRPQMAYGCGYGGSNIKQNYEVLNHLTRTQMPPGTTDVTSRQPFLPLERVMELYVPKTGVRAILMEHGYNDSAETTADFVMMFKNVMDYVRTHWSKPKLAIVLVQEQTQQWANHAWPPTTAATGLQQLIQSYPDTYAGPDFNKGDWTTSRFVNSEHLYGSDIDAYADDWNNAITPDFMGKTTPYLSESGAAILATVSTDATTYSVAGVSLKAFDWILLIGTVLCLGIYYVKRKKVWLLGFGILAAFGLGRVTNKV